ncbi:hypothetical protein HDV06_002944 [Boothiomyces sp. JEL0866]|nr:hypothetical protein HDV06_002944 [Boothiomyces sp. JEL0866]
MSSLVLQSQWLSTECLGAPSVIYVFNPNTTSNSMYPLNEIGVCGLFYNPDPTGIGCCVVSLDFLDYGNYQGMMQNYLVETLDISVSFPPTANNYNYCFIQRTDNTTDWSNAWYLEANQCIDQMKCYNGMLTVYSDEKCVDSTQELQLYPNSSISTAIGHLGSVIIELITIHSGANRVIWTSYQPGNYLVPAHKNPIEILGLIGYIVAVVLSVITLIYYFIQYRTKKQFRDLGICIIMMIDLSKVIASIIYVYTVFQDAVPVNSIKLFLDISSLSFLLCNFLSAYLLIRILGLQYNYLRMAIYLMMSGVWMLMNIPSFLCDYFWIKAYETGLDFYYSSFFDLVEEAVSLQNYYIGFIFLVDSLPLLTMFGKILVQKRIKQKKNDQASSIWHLALNYYHLIILVLLQVVIVGSYEFTAYIKTYDLFMNNDRSVLGTFGTQCFWIQAHFFSVVLFNEYLKESTRELMQKRVEQEPKNHSQGTTLKL